MCCHCWCEWDRFHCKVLSASFICLWAKNIDLLNGITVVADHDWRQILMPKILLKWCHDSNNPMTTSLAFWSIWYPEIISNRHFLCLEGNKSRKRVNYLLVYGFCYPLDTNNSRFIHFWTSSGWLKFNQPEEGWICFPSSWSEWITECWITALEPTDVLRRFIVLLHDKTSQHTPHCLWWIHP